MHGEGGNFKDGTLGQHAHALGQTQWEAATFTSSFWICHFSCIVCCAWIILSYRLYIFKF